MQKGLKKTTKNKNRLSCFIGEPTPAKYSGLVFSLSAILPVLLSLVFLLIIAALGVMTDNYTERDWYRYCNFLLPQLSFAAVVFFYFFFSGKVFKDELKRQKCSPKYYLLAVLLQIGLFGLAELNTLFLEFLEKFGYKNTDIVLPDMQGFGVVWVLLTVALLPAVFEETIFRGVVLDGMRSFGTAGAVLLCGGLFSIYHQNPAQTVYQFCCGAAFALVAIRAGSVFPTMLSHFINNALIILLAHCGVSQFPTPVYIVILCVSAVCLLVSAGWLIFFDKGEAEKELPKLSKEDKISENKSFFMTASVGLVICLFSWLSVLIQGM